MDLGPGAAAGGMGIDTLGTVAIYQRLVVVRAMKKLWEDLTFFYGNGLIVGDISDLWEGFNIILLSHCPFVRHRRDISHFSHRQRHKCHDNHQGTHQTLYILNQNHPGYLSSKDQTRQDHLLRPDQPDH